MRWRGIHHETMAVIRDLQAEKGATDTKRDAHFSGLGVLDHVSQRLLEGAGNLMSGAAAEAALGHGGMEIEIQGKAGGAQVVLSRLRQELGKAGKGVVPGLTDQMSSRSSRKVSRTSS